MDIFNVIAGNVDLAVVAIVISESWVDDAFVLHVCGCLYLFDEPEVEVIGAAFVDPGAYAFGVLEVFYVGFKNFSRFIACD